MLLATIMLAATLQLVSSMTLLPDRPALRPPPLPIKLAGGLLLFGTSVPAQSKVQAQELQELAQRALRSDPRVTMELGMGIEAGGIFASAASEDGLVINFQINGGNSWAECTAFGKCGGESVELIDLTVANMDAAMSGTVSLEIFPVWMAGGEAVAADAASPMAEAMAAARREALNGTSTMLPTDALQGKVVPTARAGVPRMGLYSDRLPELQKVLF